MMRTEETRNNIIDEYGIWLTEPEHAYDSLAQIAARVMNCPVGYFSIVSEDTWWVKAGYGVDQMSCPRDETVCNLVVEGGRTIVAPDVREHPELKTHAALSEQKDLRAYVGVPVHCYGGVVIGTLCVFDTRVHMWGPDDIATIKGLAQQLEALLDLRRKVLNLEHSQVSRVPSADLAAATEKQVEINRRVLHDFRNVLAAIQANVEFLQYARDEEEANEVVQDVRDACGRGMEVIQELQDFAEQNYGLASRLVSDTEVEVVTLMPAAE